MPVTKQFSFRDWAASRPTQPLPGDRLDDELDAIRRAINENAANLTAIRRPDGKLAPDVIDEASISPSLLRDILDAFDRYAQPILSQTSSAAITAASAQQAVHQDALDAQTAAQASRNALQLVQSEAQAATTRIQSLSDQATSELAQTRAVQLQAEKEHYKFVRSAAAAETYAELSALWAEYMPGTIPPNKLAEMGITGDHWSARWWANQAAQKFGQISYYYVGASPTPPQTMIDGSPLVPGAQYFNTTDNHPYFWTGLVWAQVPSSASVSFSLPPASPTRLGGVYASPRPSGQFVIGVDGNGRLVFATPPMASYTLPAAKPTALGGVIATPNPGGEVVIGIAGDGSLLYGPAGGALQPAGPTQLGGVLANPGLQGQFVKGVAPDGSLLYDTPQGSGGSAITFASQAEVNAGSVNNKAISPATLKGVTLAAPSGTPGTDANKIVRLNSQGKIDARFLSLTHIEFKGGIDPTQPAPASPNGGDFYFATVAGAADASWGLPPGATIGLRDLLLYDSSGPGVWHVLAEGTDMSAYLPLSGGTLTESATVTFATPAAPGLAVRLDGGDPLKSGLDGFTIDAGTFA